MLPAAWPTARSEHSGDSLRKLHADRLLPLAAELARSCGITRVSRLTGLDRVPLPCFQAVRPTALAVEGNVSVYSGTGRSDDSARLSAILEAIERYWAENPAITSINDTVANLSSRGSRMVTPNEVPLPMGVQIQEDALLEWVAGREHNGSKAWLPAHEVYCPYQPADNVGNPPLWRSMGVAAGATFEEAAYFALLEIIERDAVAIAMLAHHTATTVDTGSLAGHSLEQVISALRELDIHVVIKALNALGNIPAFLVALEDAIDPDPMLLVGGYGAHPDAAEAIERALFEALQTRMVLISGAREDFDRHEERRNRTKDECKAEMAWIFSPGKREKKATALDFVPVVESVERMLNILCDDLATQGYECFFAELTPPDYPLPVVRALMPGASHITETQVRLGKRVSLQGSS